MNILLVSAMNGLGGTERSTQQLALKLSSKEHNVKLLCSEGPLVENIKKNGIEVFFVKTHGFNLIDKLKFIRACISVANQNKVDLIHCQMAHPVPFIYIASLFLKKKPKLIYHARGLKAHTYKYVSKLFSVLNINIIANCKGEMKKFADLGYKENKLNYLYNVCQLDENDFLTSKVNSISSDYPALLTQNKFVIGSMSRLSPGRGVHYSLKYFKETIDRGNIDNPLLLIAGTGEELEKLKEKAISLAIEKNVIFLGNVINVKDFYSLINVFWNPIDFKINEGAGMGNTLIESAFMKVPVITHDALNVKELIINNKSGYVTEIGDINNFVKATEEIYINPNKSKFLIDNCYQLAISQSSSRAFYSNLMNIYEKIINNSSIL